MQNNALALWRQRFGYSSADLSCSLVWQMISLYLMYFYTDIMGLPAYLIGIMFLVTRLVDSVADVAMGLVIENTQTRWGRCRPYLLFGAIPYGLLCMLIFYVPDWGLTGHLCYAFITYLCLSLIYSVVNVPLSAMLPLISSDSRERTILASMRMVMGSLGASLVAIATLPLVKMLGHGSQQQGFLLTALLFGSIATFFLFISFFNVQEQYRVENQRITLPRAWHGLKNNPLWKAFAINIFMVWGAFFLQTSSLVYFFKYYSPSANATALVAGISTFVPLLGTLTVPFLVTSLSKLQVFLLAGVLSLSGMIIMMLAGEIKAGLLIGTVIMSIGTGQRAAIYMAMQADLVDYGNWKTGINIVGVIASVNGFLGKITMAGTGAITGVLLSSGGYTPHQIQTSTTLFIIKACYLYFPAVLILCSMGWMARYYRFDSEYVSSKGFIE